MQPGPFNDLHAGELQTISGVGETLAAKIDELLTTGRLEFFDRLSAEIPPALTALLRVEGLGPKKVKTLYDALGITTLEALKAAASEGKVGTLPGMGKKTEANILAAIDALERHGDGRTPLWKAAPVAEELLAALVEMPGVTRSSVGGSLRRMRETIGDIDLLVAAADSAAIMERFKKLPQVEAVIGSGPTKTTVQLHNGLQADLRVLPEERWGTLLLFHRKPGATFACASWRKGAELSSTPSARSWTAKSPTRAKSSAPQKRSTPCLDCPSFPCLCAGSRRN